MKKLVVYYSLTGNTRFIAEAVAKTIGAELLELVPKKPLDGQSALKYFWGGKQVITKEKPALEPLEKNPQDYDFVVLGTPVWAFNFCAVFNTFFDQIELKGKKMALFCCHQGGPKNTLGNMAKHLKNNEILTTNDFLEPLKNDEQNNVNKAINWGMEINRLLK